MEAEAVFFTLIFSSQVIPGLFSILGASLISLVILTSGLKKIVDQLPSDHAIKSKYLARFFYPRDANK